MGQLPRERPKRPLLLSQKTSGDPSPPTQPASQFFSTTMDQEKGKSAISKKKCCFLPLLGRQWALSLFLCIESYCFLGMEGLWSLLYYQRCLFSKAFKFLSCASHAAKGKLQIFALYSPPDCIYIVHLSELRYFKNLRFSTPLSVEIQMTTLQSDEKLGKTWKSLWLFPPN